MKPSVMLKHVRLFCLFVPALTFAQESGQYNQPNIAAPIALTYPAPVILVHGYCSDPGAFGNLNSLLTAAGIHVYNFDYHQYTRIGKGQPDYTIEQIAYVFAAFVHNIMAVEQALRVQVVAHSMGGLVTRTWMAGMANPSMPYNGDIGTLSMIGTPNYGGVLGNFP